MPDSRLTELFRKYLQESITPEEFSQLYERMQDYDPANLDEILAQTFADPAFAVTSPDFDKKEVFASLLAKIEEKDTAETIPFPILSKHTIYRRLRITGVAAAAVLLVTGGLYWISHRPAGSAPLVIEKKTIRFDAAPGRNGAILTLADGSQLELDSTHNGLLAAQGQTRLSKQGGKLVYDGSEEAASDKLPATSQEEAASHKLPATSQTTFNTVTTPRGRQFELVLADGTHVSLNAASSIRFPTSFTGKERRVEVSGEAYFEVAKNASQPFVVSLSSGTTPPSGSGSAGLSGAGNNLDIQVLGTSFDVAAYNDEKNRYATLLEGSIRLSAGSQQVLLTPGEQGKMEKGNSVLSHKKVDVDEVVAWTKGRLAISNSDFPALMRQISRWYDVDVVFQGNTPNVRIGGFLHRDVNLSTVLDYLAENGVHFKTEGKTITILP